MYNLDYNKLVNIFEERVPIHRISILYEEDYINIEIKIIYKDNIFPVYTSDYITNNSLYDKCKDRLDLTLQAIDNAISTKELFSISKQGIKTLF